MYSYYFTFRTVTAAMQGSRALEEAGLGALMARTPPDLRSRGCGYSLRVREEEVTAAKNILMRENLRFQRIYRKTAEGKWQEVTL